MNNFFHKIARVLKFSIQNLTTCKIFVKKPAVQKNFFLRQNHAF